MPLPVFRMMGHQRRRRTAQQGSNFANDPQKASEAGKKAPSSVSRTSQAAKASGVGSRVVLRRNGNFTNDRERASEAGRKGG
jgi:uncharacterized protein